MIDSLVRNRPGQNITFSMVSISTAGVDPSATVSVFVSVDNKAQIAGTGTVTNKGNGQYTYSPPVNEVNGINCGFLFTASGDVPVNFDFQTDPGTILTDTQHLTLPINCVVNGQQREPVSKLMGLNGAIAGPLRGIFGE